MNITNEMLQAAMKKAVEAGLLPRNAYRENMSANQEVIRFILKAALEAAPAKKPAGTQECAVTYRRGVTASRFHKAPTQEYALR